MHTDEYEISISREIDVCKGRIKAIKKNLLKMEQTNGITTEQFLQSAGSGAGKVSVDDTRKWTEGVELLRIWESKQKEFESLHRMMKK